MKKSRYTEAHAADALRLAESGTPVADVCRQIGIAEATFYLWKKKYGNLSVAEVHELRQMREENARLKRLVADLTLDTQILQEVIRKKVETSSQAGAGPVGARPAHPVVVVTDAFWRARLAADPDIVGRTLTRSDVPVDGRRGSAGRPRSSRHRAVAARGRSSARRRPAGVQRDDDDGAHVGRGKAEARFAAVLMTAYGVVALLLAAVGISVCSTITWRCERARWRFASRSVPPRLTSCGP